MRSIKIAGVERLPDLEQKSLKIEKAFTYEIDTCSFQLKGVQPAWGDEIIIEQDDKRLFAGIITKDKLARSFPDGSINVRQINCDDYTALMDRKRVIEDYENMSASDIFLDIAAKKCPGFTINGVRSGAPNIIKIKFNYVKPSECFKLLCKYVGWHWQPDSFKDLQFFSLNELISPAPMELVPGGRFKFGSHTIDTQSLKNRIYVIGGTMLSDPQPLEWKADGVARVWNLPWGPHECSFQVGGVLVNPDGGIGIENVDEDDGTYDYFLNFQEKYIKCANDTSTPTVGTTITLTAKQDIDVITMVEDLESQEAIAAAVLDCDGIFEDVITDDALTTIEAAEAAGQAELRDYSNPTVSGNFSTEIPGWEPGQLVNINLPERNVVGTFLVRKVTVSNVTTDIWQYKIEYGGRLKGIADYLQALVSAQQNRAGDTTIISKIDRRIDKAGISDTVTNTPRSLPYRCGDADAICGLVVCDSGGDWAMIGPGIWVERIDW